MLTLFYHYRDRADCENNFDEMKNQWGWGGFTTHNIKSCQLMARMVALVYNWWSLFVRLAIAEKHHEAITSRPLLLTSIGQMTEHSRQRKLVMSSAHGDLVKIRRVYARLVKFFDDLKAAAPQLSTDECWCQILAKAMEKFSVKVGSGNPIGLPAPAKGFTRTGANNFTPQML